MAAHEVCWLHVRSCCSLHALVIVMRRLQLGRDVERLLVYLPLRGGRYKGVVCRQV